MDKLAVIFGKSRNIGGYIIRATTWSRWSHVAILDGTVVYEATWEEGVTYTPLSVFKERYGDGNWEIAEIPCEDLSVAIDRARAEFGKPYDHFGVIALGARLSSRNWDTDNSRWWCSEYVAHCSGIYRSSRVDRITPEDIWKISKSRY